MLEEASSKPLTTVAQDVLYCRDKLTDLDEVTQNDASMKEELKVVTDLFVGLNLSIGPKQPILATTFLTRRLRASQTTDSAESVKKSMAELKDISQIVGRHGHQLLAEWHLPIPTNAGTQILHRDPSQSSGHHTPPARGRGRGEGRVSRGGRGGRTTGGGGGQATCATCFAAGQPANHSHTNCPAMLSLQASRGTYSSFTPTKEETTFDEKTDFATVLYIFYVLLVLFILFLYFGFLLIGLPVHRAPRKRPPLLY